MKIIALILGLVLVYTINTSDLSKTDDTIFIMLMFITLINLWYGLNWLFDFIRFIKAPDDLNDDEINR